MTKEIKMLQSIHKNADMGMDALAHILDLTEDAGLIRAVKCQMVQYQEAWKRAHRC